MCQGLPCIGHLVQLLIDFPVGTRTISRGEIGIVLQEFMTTNEVSVSFEDLGVTARVPSNYLESASGGTTPGGGTKKGGGGGTSSGNSMSGGGMMPGGQMVPGAGAGA